MSTYVGAGELDRYLVGAVIPVDLYHADRLGEAFLGHLGAQTTTLAGMDDERVVQLPVHRVVEALSDLEQYPAAQPYVERLLSALYDGAIGQDLMAYPTPKVAGDAILCAQDKETETLGRNALQRYAGLTAFMLLLNRGKIAQPNDENMDKIRSVLANVGMYDPVTGVVDEKRLLDYLKALQLPRIIP